MALVWRSSLVLAVVLAFAAPVSAQQRGPNDPPFSSLRAGAKLMFGMGGSVTTDFESGEDETQDLLFTYGIGVEGSVVVHEYVTLGILIGLGWFNGEELDQQGYDRNLILDTDVIARFRYPLDVGIPIEPYLAVPFGLSFAFLDGDYETRLSGPLVDVDVSTNVGWNLSILAGAVAWFTPKLGAMLELGWAHHVISNNFSSSLGETDVANYLDQFALNLGAMFAF